MNDASIKNKWRNLNEKEKSNFTSKGILIVRRHDKMRRFATSSYPRRSQISTHEVK